MDDDLFNVFDEQPQNTNIDGYVSKKSKSKSKKDKAKKRLANGAVKSEASTSPAPQEVHENGDDMEDVEITSAQNGVSDEEESIEQDVKRRRKEEDGPEPVVTDTFETAQSRELAGEKGLMSGPTEQTLILQHNIQHQVSLPPDYDYVPIQQHKSPAKPAREYPFELDPFQKVSIASIERGESVLVSAHTSAGKTVVAEYAIAQCLRDNQRVIYTSPIKALSNQKYREFEHEFGDVGLMTGDVTINPTATCLVMTTEILRSMLYRGSEIMREVGWVIFDEVHYLRDKVRGVVWEETLILLPDKVRYVFLSATIPNAMQFAEWITKIHRQPCHIVYTDFRPTPLQHYFFPSGTNGMHLIVDEKGHFREDNFQKAMAAIEEKKGADPADINAKLKGRGKDKKTNKGGQTENADMYKLIRMIIHKAYNPVIIFAFSKRDCEGYALELKNMSFNDESSQAMVKQVYEKAMASLSEEDRSLPQIDLILPLLQRGVAVHHSGLLPIVKETIEILFQEGLIKVLFATETFSIGLNMPAKTVVFTSVRKFDGIRQRYLTNSEFVQMSGRAGRRGLDERGVVIMMIDEKMDPSAAREIVRGEQDKLLSAFYLGYNMILNLMRVEGISAEFMLEHCFRQFQNTASVSGLEQELETLQIERDSMRIEDEATIKDYYDLRAQISIFAKDMRDVMNHPDHSLQYFQPGRLIQIKHEENGEEIDFGWAVVVKYSKRRQDKNQTQFSPQDSYIIDVLLNVASDSKAMPTQTFEKVPPGVSPPLPGERGKMEVVPVLLSAVAAIAQLRVFLSKDLESSEARRGMQKSIEEVKRRFPDGIAIVDPAEDMGIKDASFKQLIRKIEVLESRLLSNPLHNSPRLPDLYNAYKTKITTGQKIREVKKQINTSLSVIHLDELKARKRVLRRLGFIDDQEVVQLKGRVACEISSTGDGHELLLSELLFNRFFNELTPEMCAAVLSCFVFEERSNTEELKPDLDAPFRAVQQQARIIAKVSAESKLAVNEEEYVQGLKWQLMEVVYNWAKGGKFKDICAMTDIYEGSLIRLFRRLEELLRQMAQAGKVMGSEELSAKFEESLNKVRRDIVAAQSLYL